LGLLSSVVARRGGNASALTVLLLVLYFLAGPTISGIQLGLTNGGLISKGGAIDRVLSNGAEIGVAGSAYVRLTEIMRTGCGSRVIGVQVISTVVAAAFAFLLAWAGFNHYTRDWRQTDRRGLLRGAADRFATFTGRRSRPVHDALRWKEFQFVAGGRRTQFV